VSTCRDGPAALRQTARQGAASRDHVLDLHGVYMLPMRTIADTYGAPWCFQPVEREVLHKVIHRAPAAEAATARRLSRAARLAGRHARALEWRVQRQVGRSPRVLLLRQRGNCMSPECQLRRANREVARLTLAQRSFTCVPRCTAPFVPSLSIVRRTASMLNSRTAHGASTSPCRPVAANRVPLIAATCP
jgi:hypothetical protein